MLLTLLHLKTCENKTKIGQKTEQGQTVLLFYFVICTTSIPLFKDKILPKAANNFHKS